MAPQQPAMHYVCTQEEARRLLHDRYRFWVANCGCREARGSCARSRLDVCLYFADDGIEQRAGLREIDAAQVESLLREAAAAGLVTRPFRTEDRTETAGICFCCDDCCSYFRDGAQPCDEGDLVEQTDLVECDDCGECVRVCHFGARRLEDSLLVVAHEACYGCGLCVDACPVECIRMVDRW